MRSDAILGRLLAAFDGRVGEAPGAARRADLIKEAQARFTVRRLPDFEDGRAKESDARYGDFLMWSETLEFAKANSVPLIFVTSETKPDWWEEAPR